MIFTIIPQIFHKATNQGAEVVEIPRESGIELTAEELEILRKAGITQVCHSLSSKKGQNPRILKCFAETFCKELKKFQETFPNSSVYSRIHETGSFEVELKTEEDSICWGGLSLDEGLEGLIVYNFEIEDTWQRKGYGKSFLEAIEQAAKKTKLRYIAVDISINNSWWSSRPGYGLTANTLEYDAYRELREGGEPIDTAVKSSMIGSFKKNL